jgi:hypothetical protein
MSSTNSFTPEQTILMRKAIDIVVAKLDAGHSVQRRQEVAKIVLGLLNEKDCNAPEKLARAAIAQLGDGTSVAAE